MQAVPPILPPISSDGKELPPRTPEKQANLIRFQAELEFIQCLANPMYLSELAAQGYFDKSEFLNYIKYLEYWRGPGYVRYIRYPTCLAYLTLLQSEMFRDRLRDPGFAKELYRIGQRHHETWRVEEYLKDSSRAVGNTNPDDRIRDGDREKMNPKQEVGL